MDATNTIIHASATPTLSVDDFSFTGGVEQDVSLPSMPFAAAQESEINVVSNSDALAAPNQHTIDMEGVVKNGELDDLFGDMTAAPPTPCAPLSPAVPIIRRVTMPYCPSSGNKNNINNITISAEDNSPCVTPIHRKQTMPYNNPAHGCSVASDSADTPLASSELPPCGSSGDNSSASNSQVFGSRRGGMQPPPILSSDKLLEAQKPQPPVAAAAPNSSLREMDASGGNKRNEWGDEFGDFIVMEGPSPTSSASVFSSVSTSTSASALAPQFNSNVSGEGRPYSTPPPPSETSQEGDSSRGSLTPPPLAPPEEGVELATVSAVSPQSFWGKQVRTMALVKPSRRSDPNNNDATTSPGKKSKSVRLSGEAPVVVQPDPGIVYDDDYFFKGSSSPPPTVSLSTKGRSSKNTDQEAASSDANSGAVSMGGFFGDNDGSGAPRVPLVRRVTRPAAGGSSSTGGEQPSQGAEKKFSIKLPNFAAPSVTEDNSKRSSSGDGNAVTVPQQPAATPVPPLSIHVSPLPVHRLTSDAEASVSMPMFHPVIGTAFNASASQNAAESSPLSYDDIDDELSSNGGRDSFFESGGSGQQNLSFSSFQRSFSLEGNRAGMQLHQPAAFDDDNSTTHQDANRDGNANGFLVDAQAVDEPVVAGVKESSDVKGPPSQEWIDEQLLAAERLKETSLYSKIQLSTASLGDPRNAAGTDEEAAETAAAIAAESSYTIREWLAHNERRMYAQKGNAQQMELSDVYDINSGSSSSNSSAPVDLTAMSALMNGVGLRLHSEAEDTYRRSKLQAMTIPKRPPSSSSASVLDNTPVEIVSHSSPLVLVRVLTALGFKPISEEWLHQAHQPMGSKKTQRNRSGAAVVQDSAAGSDKKCEESDNNNNNNSSSSQNRVERLARRLAELPSMTNAGRSSASIGSLALYSRVSLQMYSHHQSQSQGQDESVADFKNTYAEELGGMEPMDVLTMMEQRKYSEDQLERLADVLQEGAAA